VAKLARACSDLLLVGVFVDKCMTIVCQCDDMMNINVLRNPNGAHTCVFIRAQKLKKHVGLQMLFVNELASSKFCNRCINSRFNVH